MYKEKIRKERKKVLYISPTYVIKEKLLKKVLEQIVECSEKFRAYELKVDDETVNGNKNVFALILLDPQKERKVLEIVKKYNFQKVSP